MQAFTLTKIEKKKVRKLMQKGVETEFAQGLKRVSKIISDWEKGKYENRDAYHKINDFMKKHRKNLADRYDNLTGSNYIFFVAELLANKVIDVADLEEFRDETKTRIYLLAGFTNE